MARVPTFQRNIKNKLKRIRLQTNRIYAEFDPYSAFIVFTRVTQVSIPLYLQYFQILSIQQSSCKHQHMKKVHVRLKKKHCQKHKIDKY